MPERLINHLTRFVNVPDEDRATILRYFRPVTLNKKENLLEEGQVCQANYFVLKGCLRMFFVNEKGVEHTTQFAIENWWMTDNMAFQQQRPSDFYIQAVEKTEVLAINFESQEQLCARLPQFERYFRLVYQKAYAAAQLRIKYLYDFSREELYHHFNDRYPDFIQRVPQYLLASFLGFTPEYLSEIRKKKRS
ncbi:CRP-like cAMP-binding protein [Larkinella arboricola]|uniref:CRP-like cAMP-binding protein n=1 Tax=Larkinella arboricola TaxID=643671 RepID=A0A327WXT5_LARAB|nr:Crp/Fnr family transcriptional regulator [Larkinella arboricola]RAJ97989.1 CRP-like cAMP-binding protein [Larkinella arboricola]